MTSAADELAEQALREEDLDAECTQPSKRLSVWASARRRAPTREGWRRFGQPGTTPDTYQARASRRNGPSGEPSRLKTAARSASRGSGSREAA